MKKQLAEVKTNRAPSLLLITISLVTLQLATSAQGKTEDKNTTGTTNISIDSKGSSQPVIATNNAKITVNNFSGITLEQYEEGLLRQEKRLREEFRKNTANR